MLGERSYNITSQLASLIKTFEDFKLVQQIREEIERVKSYSLNTSKTDSNYGCA